VVFRSGGGKSLWTEGWGCVQGDMMIGRILTDGRMSARIKCAAQGLCLPQLTTSMIEQFFNHKLSLLPTHPQAEDLVGGG